MKFSLGLYSMIIHRNTTALCNLKLHCSSHSIELQNYLNYTIYLYLIDQGYQ